MIASALLTAGCSGGSATADAALTPAQDALSAVNAGALALDLLREGRATAALTDSTLDDAVDQLASDEQTVATMRATTPAEQTRRETALEAIRQGTTAVLHARDARAMSASTGEARSRLAEASHQLEQVTAALQAPQ